MIPPIFYCLPEKSDRVRNRIRILLHVCGALYAPDAHCAENVRRKPDPRRIFKKNRRLGSALLCTFCLQTEKPGKSGLTFAVDYANMQMIRDSVHTVMQQNPYSVAAVGNGCFLFDQAHSLHAAAVLRARGDDIKPRRVDAAVAKQVGQLG